MSRWIPSFLRNIIVIIKTSFRLNMVIVDAIRFVIDWVDLVYSGFVKIDIMSVVPGVRV